MIVGTAGHIDHGKTSLVKAITGVDADRLKEEKARGITIDLGFAYWPQPDGRSIGFVDAPGHERFVHTMMAGAQGVDVVMLVIAADDGVMPQTREHLEIVELLDRRRGVVALTKIDAVAPERVAEVARQIAELLAPTSLAGSPIFPVSSLTGEGLAALTDWLRATAETLAAASDARLFRLAIDRSFILQGAGVVATGTVLDGRVAVGDEVTISPRGLTARVRSIHAQNRPAQQGRAGDRCALNLAGPGVSKESVGRGDMALAPAAHAPTRRIDAELRVASGAARGLLQWMPTRLHHATAEVGAHVVLLDDSRPMPGDKVLAQLVLDAPIAAFALDRCVLRDPSAAMTLAGGRFLDLRAPERKRRSPERRAVLAALALEDGFAALAALLDASASAIDLDGFARDRGVAAATALHWARAQAAAIFAVGRQTFALPAARIAAAEEAVRAALAAFHAANPDLNGMGLERLRLQAARAVAAPIFRLVLRDWAAQGWLVIDGHWLRLATHSVELSLADENLWSDIRRHLAGSGRFRPPRVRDLVAIVGAEEDEVRRVLKRCERAGHVDEVAHDHFFLRGAVGEMARLGEALEIDGGGWFNAGSFRDRLEAACGGAVGRKVAIQSLEFFDRHGLTIRRGDNRRTNPHRRALFERAPGEDESLGREASLVGRPDFKSGGGRETVPGGFDSHSLPPSSLQGREHA